MKKILIVDDTQDTVNLISELLNGEGYENDSASNGKEAINKIKKAIKEKKGYDLVLLDIMMPKMDGLATCHEIRKFSDMPIVIVSVKSDEITMKMATKLYKAEDYIISPFDNDDFIMRVKKIIK